ncbi:MAG: MFS transporter [Jatrophihabitantaceae bacterium]
MTAAATTRSPAAHPAPAHTPVQGGMFRSLKVRNYRLYAGGQLVSLTGTWMQRVAQDWLVLQLTNSGTALGVVTALQFGPSLVLGLWGGMLADRGDKRKLLLATQTGLAIVALVLGLLDVGGVVRYWHVLVLATALGIISAIDAPVRQSFVIEMVGRDELANAVAINSTIFNAGRVLGPVIAGVMISGVGTGSVFLVNALSSVGVLVALSRMRTTELRPSPQVERARGQLREGLRYVRGRADLVLTMVLVCVIGTFGLNFQLTTALMAKQVFHHSASGYGLLSAALAVGACVGAVLAMRRRRRPTQLFLLGTAVGFAVLEIGAGSMPGFGSTALLLVPTGVVMLTFTTAASASVQLGVEATMRGRVVALYWVCFMGGTPFGAPIVGWVAGAFGPRWGLVGGGLICLLAALSLGAAIARRRGLRPGELSTRLVAGIHP